MAKFLDKDPFTYQKEKESFLRDLHRFHLGRGTSYSSLPTISGKQVDLFLLYNTVTKLGGWIKVNEEQRWEEIQELFGVPLACTNSAIALKQTYVRYLSHYEKLHHFGEDPDRVGEEQGDEKSSHHHQMRKKASNLMYGVPLHYNQHQHNLPDLVRSNLNLPLARERLSTGDYNNLELSLLSGLPNEVDFAVNVCTLLSNEGKHTLKLNKCPQMLNLLLAHIGIFEEDYEAMYGLFLNSWQKNSKRDFLKFWQRSLRDRKFRHYLSPGSLNLPKTPSASCSFSVQRQESSPSPESPRTSSGSDSEGDEEIENVLNMGMDLGIHNAEGQRVLQLAMILRNLSFEQENMKVLSSNLAVYRFLTLCIHSRYNNLKQLALDTLGNMALQMALKPVRYPVTRIVLETIASCVGSSDKFQVVAGLDTLSHLCQVESNEDVLCDGLEDQVYEDIVRLLTVQDIQLIVYTLEALYQLSELGQVTTTHIAAVKMAVETLVNLVTVEAQSYSPQSLVGIKVVEHVTTVPIQGVQPEPASQASIQQQMTAPHTLPAMAEPKAGPSRSHTGTPQKVVSLGKRPASSTPTRPTVAATPPPVTPSPAVLTRAVTQPLLKHNLDLDSDAITCNWLQAHYEFVGAAANVADIPKMELFGEFLSTCGRLGIKNISNGNSFSNCVRITFPKVDTVKVVKPDGITDQLFRGLRRKAVPSAFPPHLDSPVVAPMRPPSRTPTPNSPMVAQSPPPPRHVVSPGPHKVLPNPPPQPQAAFQMPTPPMSPTKVPPQSPTQYPTIQQALMGQARPTEALPRPPTPQSPQALAGPTAQAAAPNTTLIKSLLANKVAQNLNRQQQQQVVPTEGQLVTAAAPVLPPAVQQQHWQGQAPQPMSPYQPPAAPNHQPEQNKSTAKKKKVSPPSTPSATPKTKPKRSPRPKAAKNLDVVITDSKAVDDLIESVARQGSLDSDSTRDSVSSTQEVEMDVGADKVFQESSLEMDGVTRMDTEDSCSMPETPACVNGVDTNTAVNGAYHKENNGTVPPPSSNKLPNAVTDMKSLKAQVLNLNGTVNHIGNGDYSKPVKNSGLTLQAINNCEAVESATLASQTNSDGTNHSTDTNSKDSGIKCDQPATTEIRSSEESGKVLENGYSSPTSAAMGDSYSLPQLDGAHDGDGDASAQPQQTVGSQPEPVPSATPPIVGAPQAAVQMVYGQIPTQGQVSMAFSAAPTQPQQYQMIVTSAGSQAQQVVAQPAVQQVVAQPGLSAVAQQVVAQPGLAAVPQQVVVPQVGQPQVATTQAAASQPVGQPQVAGAAPVAQNSVQLQQTQQQLTLQQQQLQLQLQQLQQMQQQIQQQQWLISQQQHGTPQVVGTAAATTPAATPAAPVTILPKSSPGATSTADQPPAQSTTPQPAPISPSLPTILPKPLDQQQQPQQPQTSLSVATSQPVTQPQTTMVRMPISQLTTPSSATTLQNPATSQPPPGQISIQASKFVVPQIVRSQPTIVASIGQLVQPQVQQTQVAGQPQVVGGQTQAVGQPQVLHGQPQVRQQFVQSTPQVGQTPQVLQPGQQIIQQLPSGQQVVQQVVQQNGQNKVIQTILQPGQQLVQHGQPQVVQQLKPGQQYVQQYIQQIPGQPGQVIRHQVVQSQPQVVLGQPQVICSQTQNQIQTPAIQSQATVVQGQPQVVQQAQGQQMLQTQAQFITSQGQVIQASQLVQPGTSPAQLLQHAAANGGKLTVMIGGQPQTLTYHQTVVSGQPVVTQTVPSTITSQPSVVASAPVVSAPTIQIPSTPCSQGASSSCSSTTPVPSPISTPPPASPQSSKASAASPNSTCSSKKKRPTRSSSTEKPSKKKKGAKGRSDSTESRTGSESPGVTTTTNTSQYVCDWESCKQSFDSAKGINQHVLKQHFERGVAYACCLWEGCDRVRRQKWSLMTHLQDRHLNEHCLKAALAKRQQAANNPDAASTPAPKPAPLPPLPPKPQPTASSGASGSNQNVYPQDAAMQAIRRFAARTPIQPPVEAKEGPVTKHIRLTSSLILRNLARYSALGRSKLKKHEQHLASVALSAVEASNPLSSCLWELQRYIHHE